MDADETSSSESGDGIMMTESVDERVPSSLDEPNLLLLLAGRNEVPYVEVDGWTRSSHVRFPGLRSDLKMKVPSEISEANTLFGVVDELEEQGENLRSLSNSSTMAEFTTLKTPIAVQVIAKKVPSVIMAIPRSCKINQKQPSGLETISEICRDVYVIGNFVVADPTGACIVTCWNEANAVLHDQVQVGDRLIINKGTYRYSPVSNLKFRTPFHPSMVDLEIKIEKYSIRAVTHIPLAMMENKGRKRLRNYLFEGDMKLFTPSDILKNDGEFLKRSHSSQNGTEQSKDNNNTNDWNRLQFFDTVGLICYAGRIQRYESYHCKAISLKNHFIIEKLKGSDVIEGEREGVNVKQYVACRWIQIIDESSKPLLVKVYVNNATQSVQEQLVPGALICITHCESKDGIGFPSYVQTTVFSQIYVNGGFMKYLNVMPHLYAASILPKLSHERCKKVLQRKDVVWSVGGVLPMYIINPDQFLNTYYQLKNEGKLLSPRDKTFARREGFTLVFHGKIAAALKVTIKSSSLHLPGGMYRHKTVMGSDDAFGKVEDGYHVLKCYRSCLCHRCDLLQWYSSRRELTPAHLAAASDTTTLLNKLVERNSKICGPLLLPAKYPLMPRNQLPPLGKLPKVDGEPFYRVGLVDEENRQHYRVIYRGYPIELMQNKLTEAGLDREIIGLLEFFCCEVDGKSEIEIFLRDFVIDTTTSRASTASPDMFSDCDPN